MPRTPEGHLVDDYDGEPLPPETTPTELVLDSRAYRLYLSPPNVDKLFEVLAPFLTDAEYDGHEGRINNMR